MTDNLKQRIIRSIKLASEGEVFFLFKDYETKYDEEFIEILYTIFVDEFDNDTSLIQLIHGFTNLNKCPLKISPLIYSCLERRNIELLDAILCYIEYFEDISAIPYLENLKVEVEWFQSYKEEVLSYLKETKENDK